MLFLPSYSPDFSPIEEAFSKVKALAAKGPGPRAKGALVEAIGRALNAMAPEEVRGWFGHCGYALLDHLP